MVDCFSAEQRFVESDAALISIFYINDHGTYIRWLIALVQSSDLLKVTLTPSGDMGCASGIIFEIRDGHYIMDTYARYIMVLISDGNSGIGAHV